MNELIQNTFSPTTLIHLNREYCYLSQDELTIEDSEKADVYLLNHLCAVKFSGVDAKSFLQGQLTTNFSQEELAPISCYLSRKGRIISLFYITLFNDDYYLLMPNDIANVFTKQLKKYVFMSKVKIEIKQPSIASISTELAIKVDTQSIPHIKLEDEIMLLCDEKVLNTLKGVSPSKQIQGSWAWQKKQLNQHRPSIYPETIATFLMHDLNLHKTDSIDFTKGCFIGQEIVARMHYKSKLDYQLNVIKTGADINPQLNEQLIIDDIKHGQVIDFIKNPKGEALCLVSTKQNK